MGKPSVRISRTVLLAGELRRRGWRGSRPCSRWRPSWRSSCSPRRGRTSRARSRARVLSAYPGSRCLMKYAFSVRCGMRRGRAACRSGGRPRRPPRCWPIETGWPPPELFVTVSITSGMRSAPYSSKAARRPAMSMSPLNGKSESMSASSGEGRSSAMRTAELDVGAGRVEVAVVGHHVAFIAHHREQDPLGGATLVGRDDVLEAGDVVDRVAEAEVRRAAGVGLVSAHHPAPLVRAHGTGAGVGEQVDDHVVRAQRRRCCSPPRGSSLRAARASSS